MVDLPAGTRARELAELAVADTGLGNVADKVTKNTRKTFGTLRDLLRVKDGRRDRGGLPEKGPGQIRQAGRRGGAVVPSTNPSATPVNKAMMALKGGNAVIIAPSPAGWRPPPDRRLHARRAGPCRPSPKTWSRSCRRRFPRSSPSADEGQVDLVVVTGSQNNVRRAYSSGTPAIGVGAGNVPVIIDASADLDDAAEKICASKIFDNATSCSSENALVILDEVYDDAIAALERAGGYRAAPAEAEGRRALWVDGKLNRKVIAKDAAVLAEAVGSARGGAERRISSWSRRTRSAGRYPSPTRSCPWS